MSEDANLASKTITHWPLSETKIQVSVNTARAWADYIETEHNIKVRGTGDAAGIIVLYHPQTETRAPRREHNGKSRLSLGNMRFKLDNFKHLQDVYKERKRRAAAQADTASSSKAEK